MSTADGPSGGPSSHLARDSAVVGAATVLSRLLGFVRDILIARMLGAGPVADAFLVAFRLPNLFRRVLGEGGLNAPFVPLYLQIKTERGEAGARRFAGEAAASFGVALALLAALTELIAPWLVLAIAGGFRDAPMTFALAESYTRLALPFLAFTTLASLLAAILNAERRFAIAALAPVLLNVVMISALFFVEVRGMTAPQGAKTLALAISVGGAAHLLMIVLALRFGQPGFPPLRLRWTPDLTRLIVLGVPALLAAATSQLVLLVATQIASVQPGAVSWLYYADRVFQLPLGFVAVAMGVVLLPEIAASEAAHDAQGRRSTVDRALVLGLALAVPAAVALVLLAEPIISILFERGKFGAIDRERTSAALAAFAIGLPFAVAAKVFAQVFFARQVPRIALYAGITSLLVASVVGHLLVRNEPATGAALAASLAFATQMSVLVFFLLRQRLWHLSAMAARKIAGIILASLAMAMVLSALMMALEGWLAHDAAALRRVAALVLLCAGGLVSYAICARLFGAFRMRELDEFRHRH